ncbi:hypothetical protein ACFSUS_05365 [Spirosoma soli]|uniref:DUF3108 domain-containing protein n=1 Tax=Spirosoma soli TaxID=1770529 RepID=A0ABW5LZ28_9BACT
MEQLLFAFLLVIAVQVAGQAQDCLGMAFKSGMNYELTMYNTNDKPIGKIDYQIKDVHKEGGSTVIDIVAKFQDEKGNQREPSTIRYTCTGNELVADMSGLGMGVLGANSKQELKMKTNTIVYPAKLSVGQKLDDGLMEAEMYMDGAPMAQMNMTLLNRQVESQQAVTTPAGSYDTYKITADINYETRVMGIPVRNKMRTVSYRANNMLFDIKSENYDKKGKLTGYTLLSKAN